MESVTAAFRDTYARTGDNLDAAIALLSERCETHYRRAYTILKQRAQRHPQARRWVIERNGLVKVV